jgi:hypothetical protein
LPEAGTEQTTHHIDGRRKKKKLTNVHMGIVPNGGNNFFKRSCRLSDEEDLTTAKTKQNGHDETFVGGGWGVTT